MKTGLDVTLKRAGLLVLVAYGCALACAGPALAHYRVDDKRWWFRGYTAKNSSGEGRSDPINIFFYRGGRITLQRIDNHLRAHTGLGRPTECRFDPPGPGCLPGATRECDGSDQWLTFLNFRRDRRPDGDAKSVDKADMVRQTSCGSRFHMRVWDDQEHDENLREDRHRIHDWGPANIHFDTEINGDDVVRGTFESYERGFVKGRFGRAHCVISPWRVMPESMMSKKGVARYSDGYVSLASLAHRSAPGRCPG